MANANPTDRGFRGPLSFLQDDALTQSAILTILLDQDLVQWDAPVLARQLATESSYFPESDALKRAMRDLIGVALLHHDGILVLPSRLALHYERLGSGRYGGQR